MNGNAITIAVVVASSVITFLLGQPDGVFPPAIVLVLGALNVALTAVSRFLPSQGTPIPVELKNPPVDGGGQG